MNRKIALILVLVVVSMLMIATAAYAEITVGNQFFSWDDYHQGSGAWQTGNIVMGLPGVDGQQPFLVTLGSDNTVVADSCGPGNGGSRYAGFLVLQHMHIDDSPAGAIGFGGTSNWQSVRCSLMDGNRTPPPEAVIGTCSQTVTDPDVYGSCEIVSIDQEFPCPQGNCDTYLQTTVRGSLDLDCNGVIDLNEDGDDTNNIPTTGNGTPTDLCFYWTAEKPPADTTWQQPLQSRVFAGSGDKTINFSDNFVPTAVSLINFAASDSPVGLSMGMVILLPLGLLGLAAAALLWKRTALG